jgi:hypothetical protein
MAGVHWVYLPEVLTDQQIGTVFFFHYMNGVELSIVTEYLIEYIRPHGTILYHAIITFLGLFFVTFVIKETQGLTDK